MGGGVTDAILAERGEVDSIWLTVLDDMYCPHLMLCIDAKAEVVAAPCLLTHMLFPSLQVLAACNALYLDSYVGHVVLTKTITITKSNLAGNQSLLKISLV